jgi:hypothetical protein
MKALRRCALGQGTHVSNTATAGVAMNLAARNRERLVNR